MEEKEEVLRDRSRPTPSCPAARSNSTASEPGTRTLPKQAAAEDKGVLIYTRKDACLLTSYLPDAMIRVLFHFYIFPF